MSDSLNSAWEYLLHLAQVFIFCAMFMILFFASSIFGEIHRAKAAAPQISATNSLNHK